MDPKQTLVERLPDIPRWVEARDLVLRGDLEVLGLGVEPELRAVLRDTDGGSIFVVGKPDDAAVMQAVSRRGDRGDLVCGAEQADWLAALLPEWTRETAVVHLMDGEGRLPPAGDGEARFIDPDEFEAIEMEDDLREELRDAASHTRIAASFARGRPVSFCYAGASSETLWDIGIDTLPQHRMAGHAARCAAFLIRRKAREGLRPVWAALQSNPASWRLGAKLGFVEVDRIALFEPG